MVGGRNERYLPSFQGDYQLKIVYLCCVIEVYVSNLASQVRGAVTCSVVLSLVAFALETLSGMPRFIATTESGLRNQ